MGTKPPAMKPSAYHGISGEFVGNVVARSEAPAEALLPQFLCAVGNVIGRRVYYSVGASKQYVNLFVGIVGPTGDGRKGFSKGEVEHSVHDIDPWWEFRGGLSTGQGLIHAVRDGNDEETGLPLVPDKRYMVFEPEFARPLTQCNLPSSILSEVLRDAYDSGRMRCETKVAPETATGAHISVIAHITQEELAAELPKTDYTNGFVNRFSWFYCRRSKLFPVPIEPDPNEHKKVVNAVKAAIALLPKNGTTGTQFDAAAIPVWSEYYYANSADRSGMIGKILARRPTQVLRFALIYAVLDGAREIRVEHLNAALALMDYAEKSAEFIFGDSTGNKIADRIRVALIDVWANPACWRQEHGLLPYVWQRTTGLGRGLTLTEIANNVLGKHETTQKITDALKILLDERFAHFKMDTVAVAGRVAQRWFIGCLMPTMMPTSGGGVP